MLFRLLLVTLLLPFGSAASAGGPDPELDKLWADPEFKKQFLGSYGIHPDVEPKLSPDERLILEKIYPLIASNPQQAATELEAAAKPDASAMFDYILGNLAFQKDDATAAAAWYTKATAKFPSYKRAQKNLGLVEIRLGHFDGAIKAFTKMLELGGGDALSYGLLAHAYSAKGDHLAAEAAYRAALLLQPDNTDWRLGLARTIFKQQKFAEAASLLEVLLERNPDKADFWLLQANAYVGMKQPGKAAENLEVVYRLGKGTPDSMNTLGDIYVNEGQVDLATSAYVRALELNPEQPPAKGLRAAELLVARGGMTQAGTVLAALEQRLTTKLAGDDLGRALKLRARIAVAEGRGEEAVQVMEQVVAQNPLDGDALMLIGKHYAKSGDPDRALLSFERAANIDGFEAQAKLEWAKVLVQKGKYREALPHLRRANELKQSDDIARYIEQVERLARSAS